MLLRLLIITGRNREPNMEVHTGNANTQRQRPEDHKFKFILGYTVSSRQFGLHWTLFKEKQHQQQQRRGWEGKRERQKMNIPIKITK